MPILNKNLTGILRAENFYISYFKIQHPLALQMAFLAVVSMFLLKSFVDKKIELRNVAHDKTFRAVQRWRLQARGDSYPVCAARSNS